MNLKINKYTYRVTWSGEDEEFVGLCAEYPSLSWLGSTPEKALSGIRQLVKDVIEDMESTGEIPPEPYSTRSYSGKFVVRIPPEAHRDLVIKAAESGISLNRYASMKLAH
ncbi:MAG: toxin-antitoxin system HicB family antitoxin [Opitutales bacterium]|nr:toxin-antitoxin system HicB family antitoxin [Opitutales bacterium]